MESGTVWKRLRERVEGVGPESVLVTPGAERAFVVDAVADDRIVVDYLDADERRPLWREQFEVLSDRLETGEEVSVTGSATAVDPYLAVLSLLPRYVVDEAATTVRRVEEDAPTGDAGGGPTEDGNPLRRPRWTVRTEPERVHDDAVLLADALETSDVGDVDDLDRLPPATLADLYVLLSDVQRGADGLRRTAGDRLLEYLGPDASLHGRFGTVRRTTRDRRRLRDEETVLNALDERGIPRKWVLGVDREKLDVVLAVTDLEEAAVYDTDEQVYVQKTAVEEAEKQSRLQGLRDRLTALDTGEARELRAEIRDLEDRLETMLATG